MSLPRKAGSLLIVSAFTAAACSAAAQDAVPLIEADAPVPCGEPVEGQCHAASPSQASRLWTVTASAGLSSRDGGPDGSYQALSLTRSLGRAYARAGVMRYHSTLLQPGSVLPSDYLVGTLAAGGNFDNWVTDGWISYGRQDYGKISAANGTRESTGAKRSGYYAIGADFGRVFALAPAWFLTPTVAGSFAHGKLLRPAPTGTDFVDLETEEPTWSGSATIRIDHAFGAAQNHYMGLVLSRSWTSNAVSELRLGGPLDEAVAGSIDSEHFADAWFDVGMTANIRLTDDLALDLYATRSFESVAGNTVAAGLSLRKSF